MIPMNRHIPGAPTSLEIDSEQDYDLIMRELPKAQWGREGGERHKCSFYVASHSGVCSFASAQICQ